jgi:hypothetical protein
LLLHDAVAEFLASGQSKEDWLTLCEQVISGKLLDAKLASEPAEVCPRCRETLMPDVAHRCGWPGGDAQ